MKKVGIITIIDSNNYGNRLQNYALQTILKNKGFIPITLKNEVRSNCSNSMFKTNFLLILKFVQHLLFNLRNLKRYSKFRNFNKYILFSKKYITGYNAKRDWNEYDYFIAGSDQIWNLQFRRSTYIDMLDFADSHKKIAYAPSFGVTTFFSKYESVLSKKLKDFKGLSCREESGQKFIEKITDRNDVEVLIDPTMLLSSDEWDKVSVRPKQLDNLKKTKYILNYFLGELSEERRKEIDKIAIENDCHIINILDKNDPFYETGPSEFLYLEKNAFLICTDSFHSSVFSIIYNTPFIVFGREGNGQNMESRIDTLLSKFKLEDRKYKGKITDELLKHDYAETYKILEEERKKSEKFLKKSLNIKD